MRNTYKITGKRAIFIDCANVPSCVPLTSAVKAKLRAKGLPLTTGGKWLKQHENTSEQSRSA